jgi:hypothetical protein
LAHVLLLQIDCPVIITFQALCGLPVAKSHHHLRCHVVMHAHHPPLNCKISGSVSCPRLPESPQWVKPITTANYLASIPEPWRKLEITFPSGLGCLNSMPDCTNQKGKKGISCESNNGHYPSTVPLLQ